MAARLTPPEGLPTWPAADPTLPEGPAIPGGLEVEIVEELVTGWTRVRCSNGWEAWVDGRRLVEPSPAAPLPVPPPPPPAPTVAATVLTPAPAAARPAWQSPRAIGIAAAVVVVLLIGLLATRGGDDAKTLSAGNAGVGSGKAAAKSGAGESDPISVADDEVEKAIADAKAAPAQKVAATDEAAALRISDEMKAAGFDLGPDVMVFPLGLDANLLLVGFDDQSPLTKLPDDRGEEFLKTFVSLPALAKAKVTRIAIDFTASDDKGPYTVTFTARVEDLRRSVENGEEIGDAAGFQVVRG